jgi:hypothetical protein
MSDAEEVNKNEKKKKVKPAGFGISEHQPPLHRFF